jgi:hypothetical protein
MARSGKKASGHLSSKILPSIASIACQYRAGSSVGRPMNVPKATVCGKEGSRESSGDSPAFLEPPECNLEIQGVTGQNW